MLIRTNIYLPSQVIQQYKQRAQAQQTTMSSLIRKTLEENSSKSTDWTNSLLQLAKQSQGSGIKTLSRDHDKYLLL